MRWRTRLEVGALMVGMEYASMFCMCNGLLFGAGTGWVMGTRPRHQLYFR